eukprot:scaffold29085_cov112-Isochrysis_galbana.AAC.1
MAHREVVILLLQKPAFSTCRAELKCTCRWLRSSARLQNIAARAACANAPASALLAFSLPPTLKIGINNCARLGAPGAVADGGAGLPAPLQTALGSILGRVRSSVVERTRNAELGRDDWRRARAASSVEDGEQGHERDQNGRSWWCHEHTGMRGTMTERSDDGS